MARGRKSEVRLQIAEWKPPGRKTLYPQQKKPHPRHSRAAPISLLSFGFNCLSPFTIKCGKRCPGWMNKNGNNQSRSQAER